MKLVRGLIFLWSLVLLTSCGFKLRGMLDIPAWFNDVAIINNGTHRDLQVILKDQLQSYNIRISSEVKGSSYLLLLEKDNLQEQITSISASTTPRQYELIYTVYYSLTKTAGQPLIPLSQVSVTRQFTVNNDRILSSNAEEGMIANEMRRDAAMQIMNRINRKIN
jgi:LPS-assembly lipoprotein